MPDKHYVTVKAAIAKDGKLLLQKELSDGVEVYSMPGGRIDEGEDPIAGLRREVMEEIGVTVSAISPLPIKVYTAHNGRNSFVTLVYKATLDSETFRYDTSRTREVESAAFVDKPTLATSSPYYQTPYIIRYFDEFIKD